MAGREVDSNGVSGKRQIKSSILVRYVYSPGNPLSDRIMGRS
jgi:hypothetical protein